MPTSSLVFIRGAFRKLRCNEKNCVAFTMRRDVVETKVSAVLRTLRRTYIMCVEVEFMPVTNATALRKNLFGTIEDVVTYNEPVTITSKSGNVVMISESDYNALMETVYLMSNPSFMEGYKEAKEQDRSTYEKLNLDEEW